MGRNAKGERGRHLVRATSEKIRPRRPWEAGRGRRRRIALPVGDVREEDEHGELVAEGTEEWVAEA